jgi:hypothetical protein
MIVVLMNELHNACHDPLPPRAPVELGQGFSVRHKRGVQKVDVHNAPPLRVVVAFSQSTE